ncbi:phosphoribosylformylglycinamidine cyclo-ligase [Candidatus Oleimmundimicrobium sp.]|uniref:phosphoribosylformylglycinamidine cyclo-ligase n=1 Tax=Candidatus Oleimmundimicrobium sp. TaxID=3060597 RepID=UPI002717FB38|nr:phosphoribosylformylglycinamidine cyclo-ligase [Candidatus Oleimmundimicrobium sp.]MDO8885614.1 phosphoribosylformylglycinamidine cyclo-ligase [Candidatus Oleimmundimicrobium sp.]
MEKSEKFGYKQAGVDIEAGAKAVELMKKEVKSTFRPEVLTEIGGFGGLFSFDKDKYKEPVLVSGTDGVGTKLKIAQIMDKHDTVGIDLVAMCVDDIVVSGAEPLFFLDYIAIGKLIPEKVARIVAGVASGCRMAGCALLGGETAEHPGVMPPNDYDLAGFCVGVVEKSKIIDGSKIKEGDIILGLASSGLHSNGYSLVRKLFLEKGNYSLEESVPGLDCALGEELLKPTKIYASSILKITKLFSIKGIAHITGGGITENIPRVLPEGCDAKIDLSSWSIPPIFKLIQKEADIDKEEMFKTFNMGIGMAVTVSPKEVDSVEELLSKEGERVFKIGEVVLGRREVAYV